MPQLAFFVIYLQEELTCFGNDFEYCGRAQFVSMPHRAGGGRDHRPVGSKWVLAAGLVLSGVASLSFQTHTPWQVILLWWIGGAGLALTTVGGASYLTRIGAQGSLGLLAAFYALSTTAARDRQPAGGGDHRALRL